MEFLSALLWKRRLTLCEQAEAVQSSPWWGADSITPVLVTALPGRQKRWGCHSGRREGLGCVKLAFQPYPRRAMDLPEDSPLPVGGVHLTFPVSAQWDAGGKGEKLWLINQVLLIWDRSLERLGLTSSVVPRHSSLTSASLTCNGLLY